MVFFLLLCFSVMDLPPLLPPQDLPETGFPCPYRSQEISASPLLGADRRNGGQATSHPLGHSTAPDTGQALANVCPASQSKPVHPGIGRAFENVLFQETLFFVN